MDFSAGVHDVICTRKFNIDRGGSRGQYYFFLVHITSCTPAEKAINVLLYNQHVYNISTINQFTPLAVYGTALFLSKGPTSLF